MSSTDLATKPLVPGERLDRATFHDRYEKMPASTKAELIGGVVYMPSPVRSDHGDGGVQVLWWLAHYAIFTPGVTASSPITILLNEESEPEPDGVLRLSPALGGQTRMEGGYLAGAPELVVEISRSSKRFDLGPKRLAYERAGVREYLVVALDPDEIHWFVLRSGQFERIQAGPDGLYRSEVFPGLWLAPDALFRHDGVGLLSALEFGLASPEHAAFRETLKKSSE
jgi:Uma2 family endonuclease